MSFDPEQNERDAPWATEAVAYVNGEIVPIADAKLSVQDQGLVHGAAVTEMIRTFCHKPFRLDDHLKRLSYSMERVGFRCEQTQQELASIVEQIVEHNCQLIGAQADLGIVVFVTAGLNPTYVGGAAAGIPTVGIHTFELPFELWAEKSIHGQHLITPELRQIPIATVDPRVKSRSRLHWILADREARQSDPQASALLLDQQGFVTETSTGNFFIVREGMILTPSADSTLPGISRDVVNTLADECGIPFRFADLPLDDVYTCDEAFTSSTPYCLLPVTRINQQTIGDGKPGLVFAALIEGWNKLVGLDILQQLRDESGPEQTLGDQ